MSESRVKYNINKSLDIASYAMPQFLFSDDFRDLSNDAKVLYMLFKDRQDLSVKSNLVDENGNIFLIITRDEIGELLNLSMKKVIKSVNELRRCNLIDEIRQGMGKPNKIYLICPETLGNTKTCQNGRSRTAKMAGQGLQAEFKNCQNGRSRTTGGVQEIKNIQDLPKWQVLNVQNGRSVTTSEIEGVKTENLKSSNIEEPENNIVEIDVKDIKKNA